MAASAAKRRTIRTTEVEVEGDEQDEAGEAAAEDQHPEAPLFSPLLRRAKKVESVAVRRTDPDSGYLGTLPPDMTESTLKARWGGGMYRLEAKNVNNQIVASGVRVLKIAGDPVFASEVEEEEWRRSHGLKKKAKADSDPGESVRELIMMLEERDEKRRAEQLAREEKQRTEAAAREERQRTEIESKLTTERQQREEERRRYQVEADEREEKRRSAAREDDQRRAQQHKEDMERMALLNQQTLQQSQAFYQQLAQTMKSDGPKDDPIKTLIAGVQLATTLGGGGGGGDEGPLTSLIKRLPETIAEARKTGGAMFAEVKASRRAGGGAARNPAAADDDSLVIRGPLAAKARGVLTALAKAGKNPEEEVDKLLTFAAASIGHTPAPAKASAPRPRVAPPSRRPRPRLVPKRRA